MKHGEALAAEIEQELRRIGEGVRIARVRRRMTQEELAARVGTSFHTIRKIEKGAPGTGIGFYLQALWVLGLFGDVRLIADPERDREGIIREAAERNRIARPRRSMSREF
jgi:transcriptional regulator with XRE-family HTH domain